MVNILREPFISTYDMNVLQTILIWQCLLQRNVSAEENLSYFLDISRKELVQTMSICLLNFESISKIRTPFSVSRKFNIL